MIRDILQLPDPRLRAVSYDVPAHAFVDDGSKLSEEARDGLDDVITDLADTMRKHHAYGLSAIQIGLPLRIVAVNPRAGCAWGCLINPVIVRSGGTTNIEPEGCMSIGRGGVRFDVKRAHKIEVGFLDRNGAARVVGLAGLAARVIQHEIDHLDGLLIDQVSAPGFKRGHRVPADSTAHPVGAPSGQEPRVKVDQGATDRAHQSETAEPAI